jgi:hypothetical protein
MVTDDPILPDDGLNELIVGAAKAVKLDAEVAVNVLTVTLMVCVVAPTGTVTVNCVEVAAVTVAAVEPNNTVLFAGVVLKLVPVITTDEPTAPVLGANEVIVGAAAKSTLIPETKIKNIKT